MEARLVSAAFIAACFLSLGASYRTQNFVVTARTDTLAKEVGDAAEAYRRDLAIEWLGRELPPWHGPCPIRVHDGPQLGAGGATSFSFQGRQPFNWTMSIQGSRERILDSVLPHEVTHTIFATHFGCPLPRWADEGACTIVEHTSEKQKQHDLLYEFLTTGRGIAFNRMFAMKEYPADVLPLYAQGYSLARYLVAKGGKRKFIEFVGDGMQWNDWPRAVREHYAIQDLSELQLTWLDWVRDGSPQLTGTDTLVAQNDQPAESATTVVPVSTSGDRTMPVSLAVAQATPAAAPSEPAGSSDGWYARVRDNTFAERRGDEPQRPLSKAGAIPTSSGAFDPGRSVSHAQPPVAAQPRVLEWTRPPGQMSAAPPQRPAASVSSRSYLVPQGTVFR